LDLKHFGLIHPYDILPPQVKNYQNFINSILRFKAPSMSNGIGQLSKGLDSWI